MPETTDKELKPVQTVFTQAELDYIDLFTTAGIYVLTGSKLGMRVFDLTTFSDRLQVLRDRCGPLPGLSAAIKLQALVTK